MGIVHNFAGLVVARLFLGLAGEFYYTYLLTRILVNFCAEGGLFPGLVYYITLWYCPHEAQFRQALFFAAASMAGAFSGILAFAIGVSF